MKAGLALFLITAVLWLAGCTESDDVRLYMVTGGIAGTYFPLGNAMAEVIYETTGIHITVMASGASADNIRQIAAGNAQIAIVQNDVMSYAFHGTGIWAGYEPVTSLATLISMYPETVQIIVAADSGIYSVSDLAGRRVSVGDVGSGVEANALQILDIHGLMRDDIYVVNMGFSGSADAMRDLQLDAFFVTSAAPNAAVMQLSEDMDLRILSMSDSVIRLLMSRYPFYTRNMLDNNHYPWLTEPVNTVAVRATLISTAYMCDQVAYDIVRTLIENQADIEHSRGAYITLQNAVQSISVDFHPGARRFFESRGAFDELPQTYLELTDNATGLGLWQYPLEEGGVFSITYMHSVNKSPVTEFYRITDGKIVLYALEFETFGAGMSAEPEQGQSLTRLPKGGMRIDAIDRIIDTLIYLAACATGHTLHIGDTSVAMYTLAETAVRVTFGG